MTREIIERTLLTVGRDFANGIEESYAIYGLDEITKEDICVVSKQAQDSLTLNAVYGLSDDSDIDNAIEVLNLSYFIRYSLSSSIELTCSSFGRDFFLTLISLFLEYLRKHNRGSIYINEDKHRDTLLCRFSSCYISMRELFLVGNTAYTFKSIAEVIATKEAKDYHRKYVCSYEEVFRKELEYYKQNLKKLY